MERINALKKQKKEASDEGRERNKNNIRKKSLNKKGTQKFKRI